MKKILGIALTALMMVLLLPACGGNSAEDVAKKVKDGAELTQADYGVMLDYVTEAFKEVSAIDTKDKEKAKEEADRLQKKYTYTEEFVEALQKNEGNFDDSNKKKYQNLQKIVLKMMGIDPALLDEVEGK